MFRCSSAREPGVKRQPSKTRFELGSGSAMPVHRKRFPIEEAIGVQMPIVEAAGGEVGSMHREIMSELRAIRAQMAGSSHNATADTLEGSVTREVAQAHALLETYRAQIEQCEKL